MEDVHTIEFQIVNKITKKKAIDPQITEPYDMEEKDILIVIGSTKVKSTEFINITKYGQEMRLILDGKDIPYTFLIIQNLFVPSNVTRIEYQLMSDASIFLSPEHYFHYLYLLKQFELDNQGFNIPLSKFNPNYLEKLAHVRLDSQVFLLQKDNFQSPLLFDISSNEPDKRSSPAIAYCTEVGRLCSVEEKLSIMLRNKNVQRPEIEEGVLFFKYLWRNRIFKARQDSFNILQGRFWQKFLQEMELQAQQRPYVLEQKEIFLQDGDISLTEPEDKNRFSIEPMHIPGEQIFNWIKNRNDQQIPQDFNAAPIKHFNLMFNRIWDNEAGQGYADTYYLIQSGIPSDLRVTIWKDLLKVEINIHEEQRIIKRKYPQNYDQTKSVYQNYKEIVIKQDCLAFRQIDEDVEAYQFPKLYCEDLGKLARTVVMMEEKRKMRNILRILVLWSRNKKSEDQPISFCYTKGLMHIIQRLLTIADEENAFWLLNGIVRMIPRLFSTDVSCLISGRNSVMRSEMTSFKATLRENLPKICDKLRLLGLSVDQLIYDSITSFYSHFFSSEVVLRLWDLIIFNLSNEVKVNKKRALWYLMAPAFWILRERQEEMLKSTTIQQVIDIYNNGSSITYNPDWIVNDLRILIRDTFVTGGTNTSNNTFSLSKLMNRGSQPEQVVDKAFNLEETRKKFEADLSMIFNSIEEENKQIGALIQKSSFNKVSNSNLKQNKNGIQQFLDYNRWRGHIMARFKKVAIKRNGEDIVDDLYKYEEAINLVNRNDLDLSMINLYLHKILNLTGYKIFRIKVYYGNIAEDGSFQSVEERYNDEEMFTFTTIDRFYAFEYLRGYNHMKIEILDGSSSESHEQCTCDLIIDLKELNSNRFIKKHYQMRNESLVENLDSFRYPFTVFVVSFFLQSHTSEQLEVFNQKRNTQMSQFINSIKRKLPDRIDIFNKKNETEFVDLMKGDFQRIIQEEFEALCCFLPNEIARNTINDNFNYTDGDGSDFGNISLANLQYLARQCFFSDWIPLMEGIYTTFVKGLGEQIQIPQKINPAVRFREERKVQINNVDDDGSLSEVMAEETNRLTYIPQETVEMYPALDKQPKVTSKIKKLLDNSIQDTDPNDIIQTIRKGSQLPFSLRNFLVSLVLMSHCTINEKFDVLYDLFDWNDGVADGLDMNSMFLLIKTIFERNLYYWPSHELFNLVEMSFDLSVSSIYQVYWTSIKDLQNLQFSQKKVYKLSDILNNSPSFGNDNQLSIDVTEQVQETLNSYQRMFGNKVLDFNFDSSAFKQISSLIKNGKEMVDITNTFQSGSSTQQFKLVIFYQVSSERYMFEVNYDRNGQLIKNQEMIEKDDIDEYLKRNINKLYLQGRSKGISKNEFLTKTISIPFLHDLIRVETLYRDRLQSTLQKKKKLSKELVVLMNQDEYLFIFRFQSRVMQNVEGDIQMLDSHTFRILMMEANEQDVISDIRERIVQIFKKLQEINENLKSMIQLDSFKLLIQGVGEFQIKEGNGPQAKWRNLKEFDRLGQFSANTEISEIIMKLEHSKHQGEDLIMKEEERDLAGFDCYSLYKHCDMSYEWRLCKIMQKEPIIQLLQIGQNPTDLMRQKGGVPQSYNFWIEFLHHRKLGQKLWLKRRREEILLSARYAREQQRNYEQETLKFVNEIYKEVFTGKSPLFK